LILQYENILASIDYLTCNVDDCLKWLRHVFRLMLSPLPSMATLLPPLYGFAIGIDAFSFPTFDNAISSSSLCFLLGFQGD